METVLKAIGLLLVVAAIILGHLALQYTIDALGWPKWSSFPFSVLIYFVAILAIRGITEC